MLCLEIRLQFWFWFNFLRKCCFRMVHPNSFWRNTDPGFWSWAQTPKTNPIWGLTLFLSDCQNVPASFLTQKTMKNVCCLELLGAGIQMSLSFQEIRIWE